MNFQTCLEQILKQFEFLWFSIDFGQCCCEEFGKFRGSVDFVVEIGWVSVRRQVLKGQQNLVCFNCRMGVPTAKLWMTCGARLLLFSWTSPRGAVGNLFLNSWHDVRAIENLFWTGCHHVRAIANLFTHSCQLVRIFFYLWDAYMARMMGRVHHFIQGSFRERSPVSSRFSESLFPDVPETATEQVRNCGFGRISSSLDRAPRIRDSVRLDSFESFSVTLPSISSETWEM